jgi:hypothetical protein
MELPGVLDGGWPASWVAVNRTARGRVAGQPPFVLKSDATVRLASAMSLRYGAFDFLVRDGTPVFLEVNVDGDWLWAEQKAHSDAVTAALVGMLTRLHRRKPPGAFDLITFLATPGGTPWVCCPAGWFPCPDRRVADGHTDTIPRNNKDRTELVTATGTVTTRRRLCPHPVRSPLLIHVVIH